MCIVLEVHTVFPCLCFGASYDVHHCASLFLIRLVSATYWHAMLLWHNLHVYNWLNYAWICCNLLIWECDEVIFLAFPFGIPMMLMSAKILSQVFAHRDIQREKSELTCSQVISLIVYIMWHLCSLQFDWQCIFLLILFHDLQYKFQETRGIV